ncbi:MAG: hypothetical protein R3D71_10925 [Rickettsiales bacterium]
MTEKKDKAQHDEAGKKTDQPEIITEENAQQKISLKERFKRIAIASIILIVFIPLFGTILPQYLFNKSEKLALSNNSTNNSNNKSENNANFNNLQSKIKIPASNIENSKSDKPSENVDNIKPETNGNSNIENNTVSETIIKATDEQAEISKNDSKQTDELPENSTISHQEEGSNKDTSVKTVESERIKLLEEKITILEENQEKMLTSIKSSIEKGNSDSLSKTNNTISSLIILGHIERAINDGNSYSTLLEQLRAIHQDNPDFLAQLSEITTDEKQKIKTKKELYEEFKPLIKQAISNDDDNLAVKTLKNFITIRKIGNQQGDDKQSIIARAELLIKHNELSKATDELEKLPPDTRKIFNTWIKDTEHLEKTRSVLERLRLSLTKVKQVN